MKIGRDTILVTGATGQQGGAIAGELLATGHAVRILTRRPNGKLANALRGMGADVRAGDFDDPASLGEAMDGAWGVFAVQNPWEVGVAREVEQGLAVVDVAKRSGVQHVVYASVASADQNTGIPHFESKYEIEQALRSSGVPSFAILRPVFFMENFQSSAYKAGIDEGRLAVGLKPDTVLPMVAVADIGKYGLFAFMRHDEVNGATIEIAGDALTMPAVAAVLAQAAGREVRFEEVPDSVLRQMSPDLAAMFAWFNESGYRVDIEQLADAYGIRPTKLGEWARLENWTTSWEIVGS